MTDAQYERLVALIADTRVEMRAGLHALASELGDNLRALGKNQIVLHEKALAMETDLTQIQGTLRNQDTVLGQHSQALEGITQLSKTNFNLIESINRAIHGEPQVHSHEEDDVDRARIELE